MRHSGKGSGGGMGSKNVVRRNAPKTEPRARSMSPAAVNQLGAKVGDHVMGKSGRSTGYRGEELVRGKGYSPPAGPTDNVKAVGVGGGRTVYCSGYQSQHGAPAAGNPTPKSKELWPGWGK